MVLAFFVLVAVSGCRQPAPPAAGWARINALLPLHPEWRMVTELDARINAGIAQRDRLLHGEQSPAPPAAFEKTTAPLAALPSPDPVPTAASLTPALNARDLAALRRSLDQEMDRRYLRRQRELTAQARKELLDTIAWLDEAADARRQAVYARYRTPLLDRQFEYEAAKRVLSTNPRDVQLQQRVTSAEKALEQMWADMAAALADIDTELQHGKAAARQDGQRQLAARLLAVRQDLDRELDKRIAGEQARLDDELAQERPAPAAARVSFPALPERTEQLDLGEIAAAAGAMAHKSAAADTRAAADIEATLANLLRQRRELVAAITRDTRAAARSLSTQHGYRLDLERAAGKEITGELRRWLREYWGTAGPARTGMGHGTSRQ